MEEEEWEQRSLQGVTLGFSRLPEGVPRRLGFWLWVDSAVAEAFV